VSHVSLRIDKQVIAEACLLMPEWQDNPKRMEHLSVSHFLPYLAMALKSIGDDARAKGTLTGAEDALRPAPSSLSSVDTHPLFAAGSSHGRGKRADCSCDAVTRPEICSSARHEVHIFARLIERKLSLWS